MARVVQLGESRCEYPSRELQSLSSNHTKLFRCGDWEGLRAALERDGYLYIQELLPRESVLSAGSAVLRHLGELENVLDPASPISSGTLQAEPVLPFLEGKTALTECSAVASVISGTHLRSFFEGLLGEAPLTFEYKWLRSVGRKGFTGAHCDRVYMSRGSTRLHTSWVPFQDTPVELGGLAVCEGSHRLPGFAKVGSLEADTILSARLRPTLFCNHPRFDQHYPHYVAARDLRGTRRRTRWPRRNRVVFEQPSRDISHGSVSSVANG
jgi:hypothetical protein